MEFGELLRSFLLDLQRLFRLHMSYPALTLPQILLLTAIPDEGMDMTTLSQSLGVDNSTMTRLVEGLLRKKLVVKERGTVDRRVTVVKLTDQGERLQWDLEERIDAVGEALYDTIPPIDREEVKEILSTFHWTLSKYLLHRR